MAHPHRQLHLIDLLRFASAMLVVAYHYGSAFALSPSASAATALAETPVAPNWVAGSWFGWVGVEVFFVISGFVIAISAQGTTTGDFVRRRILRLAPAAWTCATISLIVLIAARISSPDVLIVSWLRSIAFWPLGRSIDPVYWTLGIEISFYASVASVIRPSGDATRIERVAQAIGGASMGYWAVVLSGHFDFAWLRFAQLLLLAHGCFFALGVTIWAILDRGLTRARGIAFALFFLTCLIEIQGTTVQLTHELGIVRSALVPQLIFAVAVTLMLAASAVQTALNRLRAAHIAATLGLMTYPLYLVHQDAGAVAVSLAMKSGASVDLARGVALIGALCFAYAVVRCAEPAIRSPLDRLIRRVIPRRDRAPDTHPTAFPSTG